MRHPVLPFFALLLVSLASCSSRDDESVNEQKDGVENSASEGMPEEAPAELHANADAPDSASPAAMNRGEIPPAIRGRWGMVKADCTSLHGDAKGLLEISKTTLNFYESRGTLATMSEWEPTRIRARFAFEGEGMSWQRDTTLSVQDDGQTLIRQDIGEDMHYRYSRCP